MMESVEDEQVSECGGGGGGGGGDSGLIIFDLSNTSSGLNGKLLVMSKALSTILLLNT